MIEYNDNSSYCYIATISNTYVFSAYANYNSTKRQSQMYTELVLEGDDLDILFEEAEKALWH